jgi:hypothetical protein
MAKHGGQHEHAERAARLVARFLQDFSCARTPVQPVSRGPLKDGHVAPLVKLLQFIELGVGRKLGLFNLRGEFERELRKPGMRTLSHEQLTVGAVWAGGAAWVSFVELQAETGQRGFDWYSFHCVI